MVFGWIVNEAIPSYLKSVPIPNNLNDIKFMSPMEWGHLILFVGAAGYIGFAVAQVQNHTKIRCEEKVFRNFRTTLRNEG